MGSGDLKKLTRKINQMKGMLELGNFTKPIVEGGNVLIADVVKLHLNGKGM